jgi:hypothetical protein
MPRTETEHLCGARTAGHRVRFATSRCNTDVSESGVRGERTARIALAAPAPASASCSSAAETVCPVTHSTWTRRRRSTTATLMSWAAATAAATNTEHARVQRHHVDTTPTRFIHNAATYVVITPDGPDVIFEHRAQHCSDGADKHDDGQAGEEDIVHQELRVPTKHAQMQGGTTPVSL